MQGLFEIKKVTMWLESSLLKVYFLCHTSDKCPYTGDKEVQCLFEITKVTVWLIGINHFGRSIFYTIPVMSTYNAEDREAQVVFDRKSTLHYSRKVSHCIPYET